MTSEHAKRLAYDLVLVGQKLGFEAGKEYSVIKDSHFKVDVFWNLRIPDSPLPPISIAIIEIQYSKAPHSIEANIFKAIPTLKPAFHVIVSYNELGNDLLNILKRWEAIATFVIFNGEDEVSRFNLWIATFLTLKDKEDKLIKDGKAILDFAKKELSNTNETKATEKIREVFAMEIKEIFLPPEVDALLDFLNSPKDLDRSKFDKVYETFIEFVQEQLKKYSINGITFPANLLFPDGFEIEEDFEMPQIGFENYFEIKQNNVIIRDDDGGAHPVEFNDGNTSIETDIGTACTYSMTMDDFIDFITQACEIAKNKLEKYQISEEDRKKLQVIEKALNERV
jgi:hypothetical protein